MLEKYEDALQMTKDVLIETKLPGEIETSSKDLKFSGKIFFYYEGVINQVKFLEIQAKAKTEWTHSPL